MAVPVFHAFLLPMLRLAGDGAEHSMAEARQALADEFKLTEQDRTELLPSSRQTRLANRIAWAKVYLSQAGLVQSERRGHFRITQRGRDVLSSSPTHMDIKYLEQFPEFLAARTNVTKSDNDAAPGGPEQQSPEETLVEAHLRMRAALASEVLARVKAGSPEFFERLVVELLLRMGYGGSRKDAGRAVGKSGDEGIDGVISEDRLGLDIVYLQAKRWDGTVSRPDIQRFVGALHGKRAKKGVFITTGSYSKDAISYVDHIEPKVVLVDGTRLAELMIDFDVGVTTIRTYHVKRLDSDYFEES